MEKAVEQMIFPGIGVSVEEKTELAIETIRFWEHIALMHHETGYHLCYSGGKDSVVILKLTEMAGVRFTVNYNVTTIDPPEVVYFIRRHCPGAIWHRHSRPMMALVPEKNLPTRRSRWCCALYKERSGNGKVVLLGLRAAESAKRKANWNMMHKFNASNKWALNPILYWSDEDVWDFIRRQALPYCSLYDEGFTRLGCIACPMASEDTRKRELARWPRYHNLWRRAAHRLWKRRAGTQQRDGRPWWASEVFANADSLFEWWLSDKSLPKTDCGMGLW